MKSGDLKLGKEVGGDGGFMDEADAQGQGKPEGNTGILFLSASSSVVCCERVIYVYPC